MKVVILGSAHPLRGGLAVFNERLCQAFLNQQHQAQIYTFSLQYPSLLFPGKSQYTTEPAPKGIPITVAVNSINPLNWFSVGKKIATLQPDILIIKFWLPFMAPCFGTIAKQVKKYSPQTQVVTILDNVVPHEKRPLDTSLTRYFLSQCNAFVAMSNEVMNDLQPFLTPTQKNKTALIPHPIYDNFGEPLNIVAARQYLQLNTGINDKYILFFGLIRSYKGLDTLLEAMANPQIKAQNIKLIVAGEFYEPEEPYHQIIQKYQLQQNIILHTRFIPDSEVKYYFCAADLVVLPYKTATQSGITQIAYHFEKPMVVTNVGGLPEIVPHNEVGYVIPPENPTELAETILNYYQNKAQADYVSHFNIRAQKYKFSWENMRDGIIKLTTQNPEN